MLFNNIYFAFVKYSELMINLIIEKVQKNHFLL